jgi:carboxyl-terminal processing protease
MADQHHEPHAGGSRNPTPWLALVLVMVLAGTALFVSGFSLGRLSATTGGTGASREQLFRPFWDAYNDIVKRYVGPVDQEQLVQGAIEGLFRALGDPFSFYMTEQEYRNSLQGLSGQFEGIGAQMATQQPDGSSCTTISATCRLVVTAVLRSSPALMAGLEPGDVVLAVDGKAVTGASLDAVIALIRGPKGTTVTLTLERGATPRDMAIQRDVIQREDVTSQTLADGRIGYVQVRGFSAASADDLHAQLADLVSGGAEGLILDLRDDPGGYVEQAQRIASEFVGSGTLYWEQSARADPVPQPAASGGVATDQALRLVVLVNHGTASASEIVAAAIRGNQRGLLVGQTTYGKGTVQEFIELPGAGGYRLSVRKWLTPDQTWIHGVGLTPDVAIEPASDDPAGTDTQRDAAVELLLSPQWPLPAPTPSPAPAPTPTGASVPAAVAAC